MGPLIINRA